MNAHSAAKMGKKFAKLEGIGDRMAIGKTSDLKKVKSKSERINLMLRELL